MYELLWNSAGKKRIHDVSRKCGECALARYYDFNNTIQINLWIKEPIIVLWFNKDKHFYDTWL